MMIKPCNKQTLKHLVFTSNEFIKNNCLKGCKKLNSIQCSNNDGVQESLFLCLKHRKSIITLLNENPNFVCIER